MATLGFETATSSSITGSPANRGAGHPVFVSRYIDFSAFSHAANDIIQAILVPDNHAVMLAGIEVLTADTAGNSGTVALGLFSGIAAGGYVAAAAPTTVGQMVTVTVPAGGFVNEGTGKHDTIDVTVATGAINAKIRVWAVLMDLSGLPNEMPYVPTTTAVLS